VSAVVEEFERQLAAWRRRYAGHPEREMVRVLVLALEREELVSVGYREALMTRRLAEIAFADEVRDLIHHALVWVWKDEEMHAIYVRGAILKLGRRWLSARAYLRQLAGAVGGWAASARQHVTFRRAPLARAVADLVTWGGILSGQVPREVRRYLRRGPFRDFCLFNVDAEKTARLAFVRLEELWRMLPATPEAALAECRKMQDDEDRHGRLFALFAAALDDEDRLRPGETADSLAAQIGAVGEAFLPRGRRGAGARANPMGGGGPVWVAEGAPGEDKRRRFRRLLADAGLAARLAARAAERGKGVGELRVAVKPTFMLAYNARDPSVITDPELVDELAQALRGAGVADVAVVEGPNLYDRFYARRSVAEVAAFCGYASPHYRVVDLADEQVPHAYGRGLGQYSVGRTWQDADFRISFGKLRSHPIDLVLLSVGNLEWLGGRCDDYVFVERQAHRETATLMLIDDFPPHFALLEGWDRAPDGLLGVMGCRRPPAPRRLYAGADPLAVDEVAGRHLGLRSPLDSPLLRAACHWFGVEPGAVEVRGPDRPVAGWRDPYYCDLSTLLSILAYPVYVIGSARGALFVPEMDEAAFPPLAPVSRRLRWTRRALQTFLGLRLPRARRPSPSPAG
jgi:Domain of unknown function (DUF362)